MAQMALEGRQGRLARLAWEQQQKQMQALLAILLRQFSSVEGLQHPQLAQLRLTVQQIQEGEAVL